MPNGISLTKEGTVIHDMADSSAVSNKPREQLCSGSSRDKTVAKHLIRFRSAMQGAVKITDFAHERRMNMDFH